MTQASISTPTQQARVPGDAETFVNGPLPSAYDIPLEDVNPANPRLFAENRWQETFERLRAEDPVHFNETELAGVSGPSPDTTKTSSKSTSTGKTSSAKGIALGFPVDAPLPEGALKVSMFIAQDPPVHDVQRKTVAGVVAPSNLAKMEGLIRSRTAAVLDSLPEQTPFDWVDTVSIELTTMMLATLFDFPFEQRRKLTRWSDVVTAVPGRGVINSVQERRDELLECLSAFTTLWEQRKREPGDDLVSMLAHGEETKDMQPMEFLGNLMLLIVGGNDTTRNTMTGSVYGLHQFPEQFAKLKADPTLVPNMVAEIIRWQTPLSYMRRTANADCELGGKQIKKNDQILMWYVSGNRDPSVFENPDAIDITRPNARSHLSFGFGLHRCMGNRLAELQLRILWEELLARFETIEVLEKPERTYSSFVKGYTRMPVRVRRR